MHEPIEPMMNEYGNRLSAVIPPANITINVPIHLKSTIRVKTLFCAKKKFSVRCLVNGGAFFASLDISVRVLFGAL